MLKRKHGLEFAVYNILLQCVEVVSDGNERITTIRLHTKKGTATLVRVYAHTLYSDQEVKYNFYKKLNLIVSKLPKRDQLIILGDLNARVGPELDSWARCRAHFNVGKMNSNGQRLLEFCHMTNSFFKTKPQHKASWRHPRSKN